MTSLSAWGQVKKTTSEAPGEVTAAGKCVTAKMLLLAIFSILTFQPSCTSAASVKTERAFWAYLPNPPFLHPVSWTDKENLKIFTNDTKIIGGLDDTKMPQRISSKINYTGISSDVPICFSKSWQLPLGCLPSYRQLFLTDTENNPHKENQPARKIWELQLNSLGGAKNVFQKKPTPREIYNCEKHFKGLQDSHVDSPKWLSCGFDTAAVYQPVGTDLKVFDFSISKPDMDFSKYVKVLRDNPQLYDFKPSTSMVPHRWFPSRWVSPTYFSSSPHHNSTNVFSSLFRLVAATDSILLKEGDGKGPVSIDIEACLNFPYVLLMSKTENINISSLHMSYHISCKNCIITNCINPKVVEDYFVIILLKQPPYVMLPVKIQGEWYDDSAVLALKKIDELMRPKRFVAALVLGIISLIAISTSVALSVTALVQEVQTATHVNNLSKNVSLALVEQEIIDQKLEAKVNALEDVVIWLSNEVQNLKIQMSARCHYDYKYMCVTPHPYNLSESWDKVKNHLLGVWKNNDLSLDIKNLQEQIAAISKAKLETSAIDELVEQLWSNVQALNPVNWPHWLTTAGIGLVVLILCVVLIPTVVRMVYTTVRDTWTELASIRKQVQKEGHVQKG